MALPGTRGAVWGPCSVSGGARPHSGLQTRPQAGQLGGDWGGAGEAGRPHGHIPGAPSLSLTTSLALEAPSQSQGNRNAASSKTAPRHRLARGPRKPWHAWFTPMALRPRCPELLPTGMPWPDGIERQTPRQATQRGATGARPEDPGLPSWNLGLVHRGPATTNTSPLPSRGRGQLGFLARDGFQLSSSKTTTRLASHEKRTPVPQVPWVVSETVGGGLSAGRLIHAKPVSLIPREP